jgi:hypothetical protein
MPMIYKTCNEIIWKMFVTHSGQISILLQSVRYNRHLNRAHKSHVTTSDI